MAIPSITRENVLAFRQRATFLHRRLPPGRLVDAAFAGLQDSSPRSAVLALHARVRTYLRPPGGIPGSFRCGVQGAPYMSFQVAMWPFSRLVGPPAIPSWQRR